MRPTDVTLFAWGGGTPAKVIVVEHTGAETEPRLEVGGAQLVVVTYSRPAVKPADIFHLNTEAEIRPD